MDLWPLFVLIGVKLINLKLYSPKLNNKILLPESKDFIDKTPDKLDIKDREFKPYPTNYRFFC